jgi:hypothetical protein
LVEEDILPVSDKEDITTSLVRQWLTYDGHATLFLEEEQVYLHLDRSPLGKLCVRPEEAPAGWMKDIAEQWKIDLQALPDVCDQLNRGQSAAVTNDDDILLRLWVNPKERSKGVEPPDKQPLPPGWKPDYHKIAAHNVRHFCRGLDADEVEQLIDSVVRQWQQYEGHACLFFSGEVVTFLFTHLEDGSQVTRKVEPFHLEATLAAHLVPPEDVPEMIARLNLGQEIEFRNGNGKLCRLWPDPKAGRIYCRPLTPPWVEVANGVPPLFCPACGVTLFPWEEAQQQQGCLWCGQAVPRS